VAEFDLPPGLESVRHAWLELRADVTAQEIGGFLDPAPLFEVYMLKEDASGGEVTPSMFETTTMPLSRPVAAGENRLVRIDITEVVQMILADPSKNHGIAPGALTEDTRGIFTVRPDGLGPNTAARITIIE
jgi:hypothetical protein